MFYDFINFPVFFVSLAIGLFYVYISVPRPKVIYVYPTPDNLRSFQYKDDAENCFSFDVKEEKCPSNGKFKVVPVQTSK